MVPIIERISRNVYPFQIPPTETMNIQKRQSDSSAFHAPRGLGRDVVAGVTVGASQVGNAMAYTILAGVPPVHGLYATMVGTPVAALTGSSQRMTVVPTAALCLAAGARSPPCRRSSAWRACWS